MPVTQGHVRSLKTNFRQVTLNHVGRKTGDQWGGNSLDFRITYNGCDVQRPARGLYYLNIGIRRGNNGS